MKNILFIALLLGTSTVFAQPIDPYDMEIEPTHRAETALPQQQPFEVVIVNAFKQGNAAKIAKYFSENVDLAIDGKEDLYSKSQAEQILKNFFLAHKPSNFEIVHKGKSGISEYFIGELTAGIKYKVTLNSKTISGVQRITSLTISPA